MHAFTLHEYIANAERRIEFADDIALRSFLAELRGASDNTTVCQEFSYHWFGIAFRGSKTTTDFWFTALRITLGIGN